ncbi:hypothetical protein GD1_111 [Paraglaciecola Antarctic GD virus 1]|nr:hypothetical protein GD1_111 [Paraglaciecola Antarctic GD virus 1]
MLIRSYVMYSDAGHEDWVKFLSRNTFRILRYQWELANTFRGWGWKRKQFKRLILKCKQQNRNILVKKFPIYVVSSTEIYCFDELRFVLDMWKNDRHQSIPVLEIWHKNK